MYREPQNTEITTICEPGFASLLMSYFKTYLTLDFAQWLYYDNIGRSTYCQKTRKSTTVNAEGAKLFYQLSKSIIDGSASGKQVETVLPCKRDTSLIFEYKPESDGQMMAYLSINKEDKTIRLRFPLHYIEEVDENGQTVTKVIQRGLGTFAKVMYGYLVNKVVSHTVDKLPDKFNEYQDYHKQVAEQKASLDAWNNNKY